VLECSANDRGKRGAEGCVCRSRIWTYGARQSLVRPRERALTFARGVGAFSFAPGAGLWYLLALGPSGAGPIATVGVRVLGRAARPKQAAGARPNTRIRAVAISGNQLADKELRRNRPPGGLLVRARAGAPQF
jgi:hypothetical protein